MTHTGRMLANQHFLYFYIYEWLKAFAKQLGVKPGTLSNAAMGTMAGVANLTVTLPVETIIVRLQVLSPELLCWTVLLARPFSRSQADSLACKHACWQMCRLRAFTDAFSSTSQTAMQGQTLAQILAEYQQQGLLVAYRGFATSSILTLNPAFTFSIFDALKARILKALSLASGRKITSLSAVQVIRFIPLSTLTKCVGTFLCSRFCRHLRSPASQRRLPRCSHIRC